MVNVLQSDPIKQDFLKSVRGSCNSQLATLRNNGLHVQYLDIELPFSNNCPTGQLTIRFRYKNKRKNYMKFQCVTIKKIENQKKKITIKVIFCLIFFIIFPFFFLFLFYK